MTKKHRTEHEATQVVQREVPQQYHLCPSCGNFAASEERESYCMVCGATLISSCPGCHEPIIHPTARFCPRCGTQMVASRSSKDK